jgi:hypothetical protein
LQQVNLLRRSGRYYEVSLNFEDGFLKRQDALWTTAHFYGGNGDGYLLYPGTPDRIGGSVGIPIESIRLKHIRDGFEDHQYLRLLERLQSRGEALHHLKAFMASPSSWVDDVEGFRTARVAIGRAIEAAIVRRRARAAAKTDDGPLRSHLSGIVVESVAFVGESMAARLDPDGLAFAAASADGAVVVVNLGNSTARSTDGGRSFAKCESPHSPARRCFALSDSIATAGPHGWTVLRATHGDGIPHGYTPGEGSHGR